MAAEKEQSLAQIIQFRKEKAAKLQEMGVNPYPYVYDRTHRSTEIIDGYEKLAGKTVSAAGRLVSLRRMGKAAFFHIQDDVGKIQCYVKRDNVGEEDYEVFKLLDMGDIVGAKGNVFTTKTGEISIDVAELAVLAKSIRPLPGSKEKDGETFHAFADKEQRYRQRHLDLVVNPEVRDVFRKRAQITSSLRAFLDQHEFLEVETPVLQPIYGGAFARPFTTHHQALDSTLYLRIADELYLKRLIIGGFDRVYEMAKDFRNEGMDKSHNPEFTMLEWYEAYSDYEDQMDRVENIIRLAAKAVGKTKIKWANSDIDLTKAFDKIPFLDLLKDATGYGLSDADEKKLRSICREHQIEVSKDANFGQLLDNLMHRLVEPNLIQPVFVIDHPKAISPLAKHHRNGDPNLVERFELFIGGAEFANCFSELNDPLDQRKRLEDQAKLRDAGDDKAQPVDENFIEAMECGMPPTGGVGLGVDRLVMLLTENRSIRDVLLFPAMRT